MTAHKKPLLLLGVLTGVISVLALPSAQATVIAGSVTIDSAPTIVPRGSTFDVTFSWNHAHCNGYGSTLTVGSLATPIAQTTANYSAGSLSCPGPNTRTESLTIPANAPTGTTQLTVNVAEFVAGNGFDDETSQAIYIAAGACPPEEDGWFYEPALSAADPYDKNGDGLICTKLVGGKGNSLNSQRDGGSAGDVGHLDGHNHKDNSD